MLRLLIFHYQDQGVLWDETDSFVAYLILHFVLFCVLITAWRGNKTFFGEGIFTSLGERHRRQRKMLNPVFSINHMREMGGWSIVYYISICSHCSGLLVLIFYDVAHKVHIHRIHVCLLSSNWIMMQVERVFDQKVSNGPKEVRYFLHSQKYLWLFNHPCSLMSWAGWHAWHWNLLVKVAWDILSTTWLKTLSLIDMHKPQRSWCTISYTYSYPKTLLTNTFQSLAVKKYSDRAGITAFCNKHWDCQI